MKPLLHILGLVSLFNVGHFTNPKPPSGWVPASFKYYKNSFFSTYERYYELPQDYGRPNLGTLKIYARMFRNGDTPDRIILMIPGGPGQSGKVVEMNASVFEQTKFKNSWLITIDHRGVSKSVKLTSNKQHLDCVMDIPKCVEASSSVPIYLYSPENAARDHIEIIRNLKKAYPNANFYAEGTSYGSYLLYRILSIDGGLFKKVFFNDLFSSYNTKPSDISQHIMENCHADHICRKLFPDAKFPEKVMQTMTNPNLNQCTKYIDKNLSSAYKVDGKFAALVQHAVRKIMTSLPADNGNPRDFQSPQAAYLYFFQQLSSCSDFEGFKSLFEAIDGRDGNRDKGKAFNVDSSNPFAPPTQQELDEFGAPDRADASSKVIIKGNAFRTNRFINQYIVFCELSFFDLLPCIKANLNHTFNACVDEYVFKETMSTFYDDIQCFSDKFEASGIAIKADEVVLSMGKLDIDTPFDSGKKAFDAIMAPKKRIYVANHFGHGGVNNYGCRVIDSIVDDSHFKNVEQCLKTWNSQRVNWVKYKGVDFSKAYSLLENGKEALIMLAEENQRRDSDGSNIINSRSSTRLAFLSTLLGMFLAFVQL